MARFGPVHTASLDAESSTRKFATATKRRRNQGTPAPGEFAMNAYNVRRNLINLSEALTYLIDEHGTLGKYGLMVRLVRTGGTGSFGDAVPVGNCCSKFPTGIPA